MRTRYYWLLVLAILSIVVNFVLLGTNYMWVSSLAGNLAAGFIGSFLTVWLIDDAIEMEHKKERDKKLKIALIQLRPSLISHIDLISNWYKAAAEKKPAIMPDTISEIFNEDYYQQIRFLDFSKNIPSTPSTTTWFKHTASEFTSFKIAISETIVKYGDYLEPNTLSLLELIADSPLTYIPHFEFLI